MFGIFLLILVGAAFYGLIAFGPEAMIKIFLALCWALMLLSIPVSLLVAVFR